MLRQLQQDQEKLMVLLIKARKAMREGKNEKDELFLPYVDTLFDLQLKEENIKLEEKEIVTLCSEFFTGGIDTTSTTLEWMMMGCYKKMLSLLSLSNKIVLLPHGFYLRKTTSRLMFYRRVLHSQQKGDMSIKEFLLKIKSYCDNLASCGEAISAHEHITAILNGLSFEYDPIVSIILAGQHAYTVQSVTTMLLDTKARQQVILAETPSSANLVSQQPAQPSTDTCYTLTPHIQDKLFKEIKGVVSYGEVEIKDDDLRKMPYLRAITLESLRRHPPSHFLILHTVTKDVVLGGFLVPKNSIVIFIVVEMGRNPNVWENPMEFKPERFLNNGDFDISGTTEIKMMPFGVGKRMCPAYRLAMLHLKYSVANLVWHFNFK
ncbi:hypothetical protein Godav_020773 [Gossypium davidsonii]|uniref:Cytochrome P450 n=1 Tax=Gossypium davidsonii TaxID=34287 RepID=A0A7J8R4C3_GOSDV|nr:hypothetical protein [Gossypium davidsonii]